MHILEAGNFSTSFGLIQSPCKVVAEEFLKWKKEISGDFNLVLDLKEWPSGFTQALAALCPRTTPVITRFLFWPVNASWTLYFDNSRLGTDAGPPFVLSSRLSVNAFRVVMVDQCKDPVSKMIKKYGAVILEYYCSGNRVRHICAANDGGKWVFSERGQPFLFENTASYTAKRSVDRFTKPMLLGYLKDFGVDLNDISDGPGFLVINNGKRPWNFEEYDEEGNII